MRIQMTGEEQVLALNEYLARAGFRGWYEPAVPFEPLILEQRGLPRLEPYRVVSTPMVLPDSAKLSGESG